MREFRKRTKVAFPSGVLKPCSQVRAASVSTVEGVK